MDQRRHGSCMERMDYETPGLGTKYKCSLRFHQVTTLLDAQSAPKSSPRSHMDSALDVLYMDGKIRGY
jgi:hypothetical protein